jgi:hypothetical protein
VACLGLPLACAATPEHAALLPADAAPSEPAVWLDTAVIEGSTTCYAQGQPQLVLPEQDWDQDGWSGGQGDCNDCDPNVNPGALDVAGNGVDEDCSGVSDDEPGPCDGAVELHSNDPWDGARAVGLCRVAQQDPADLSQKTWGVLSAAWQLADGSDGMHYASHGMMPDFGPHVSPQEGALMLALSSATARRPSDPGYEAPLQANMATSCATPAGWPKPSPSCSAAQSDTPIANDSAALSLRIRVPTNARSLSFRFAFYTAEFPAYVCNQYNDFFVALLDSQAASPLAQDGNISFDQLGNPVSVNSAFLEVCTPQVAGGKPFGCLLGSERLVGTGFEASSQEPRGHAATGWLQTTAAVQPGEELTLRWVVWDGGDHLRGSTVLLDAVRWDAEGGKEPVTQSVK